MKTAKHTPGPWHNERGPAPVYGLNGDLMVNGIGIGAGSEHIATVTGREATRCANARLIAAAPYLYEALTECDLAFVSWQLGQIPGRPDDILRLITKARTALAEADGGMPPH